MGYRWGKTTFGQGNLIEGRQMDLAYSNFTSVVNGGMDRDNLPLDCVARSSVNDQGIGKAQTQDNIHIPFADATNDTNFGTNLTDNNPRGNRIRGYAYTNPPIAQGDNFFDITSDTIDTEEGMLHVQFKVHTYIPQYWAYYKAFTSTKVARKRVQFQVLVNGVVVYLGPAIAQSFFTHNYSTMIPISKGTQTVAVRCRVPALLSETDDQVVLSYWGGQMYMHNYYR
jgi:hypothetical protein